MPSWDYCPVSTGLSVCTTTAGAFRHNPSTMVNADTQAPQMSVPPPPTETDQLLQRVSEQLAQDTFDPSNQPLLAQLVACLGDTRGMTRLRVAETLGVIGPPATPVLERALRHAPNPVVRRAAAKTLTLIADPQAIPTLLQALLQDPDTVVKGSSVAALAKMGAAAVPDLLAILEAPEHPSTTKGHAAWALAFIGTEAQAYLTPALHSESSEVRAAVVGAIAKVADETADTRNGEILINALTDGASMVRCEAAAALGNLAYLPAFSSLVALLPHPDWETRKAAALALMKLEDLQAIAPLQTALAQESNPAVEKVLALAIAQLQR